MSYGFRRTALAVATLASGLVGAVSAHAEVPYEFQPAGQTFALTGVNALQAGAHSDVDLEFGVRPDPSIGFSPGRPAQATKTTTVELPVGLVGNPTVLETCSMDNVLANEEVATAGRCPRSSAVGVATFDMVFPGGFSYNKNRRRIWRVPTAPNEAAAFATSILGIPIRLVASVAPSTGYRIRISVDNLPQSVFLRGLSTQFWGVPSDHQGPGLDCDGVFDFFGSTYQCLDSSDPSTPGSNEGIRFGAPLNGAPRKAFLSSPGFCDGQPLKLDILLRPWGARPPVSTTLAGDALSGCGAQPFAPSIAVKPSTRASAVPNGLEVALTVPQSDDAAILATSHVKDVSVTLPKGVSISPGSANGLEACTDAQFDRTGDDPAMCPKTSRIGGVTVDTPVLEEPLRGVAYLGTQQSQDPESGDMFRLFLNVEGPGVLVKLQGSVVADAKTGQLTARFTNNPQMPFESLALQLDAGDRSALVNPSVCGTHTTTARLTSWGGHVANVSSDFAVDQDCGTGRFAPTLLSGTSNPLAGAYSPFSMSVSRDDRDQELSSLTLDMPSGLLGALGSVPVCAEAQAAAGSCGGASRIGSTTVEAGTGAMPYSLPGSVYLAGPYKGAPFSLSVVVPVKAGPFDLGTVVVRAKVIIDASKAKVQAVTDPFPTIVGGVPVSLRTVDVTLDRPGFMFNATSCEPQAIGGAFLSVGGAGATSSVRYQPTGCDQLKLDPKLSLEWTGKGQMRKGKHPGVTANLGDMLGQANLKSVKVTLPLTAALDPANAKALCEAADGAAGNCPESSRVGWASAVTPALHEPVEGPVYFVKGTRVTAAGKVVASLPKLFLKLAGEGVSLDLWADSEVDGKKRLVTTFANIPDVPVKAFKLTVNSGRNGIIEATNDVCGASKATVLTFTGHNGGVTERAIAFRAPECKTAIVSATGSSTRVSVRVGGIGAGKLTLGGPRVVTARKTVKRSDAATVTGKLRLSKSQRAALRGGRSVRVAVRVTFKPKSGKSKTVRKNVRIQGVTR